MIKEFEELDLSPDAKTEDVVKLLEEKLQVSFAEITQRLSAYVVENADLISEDIVNIAPLGDYSKLIEERPQIVDFLKTEAHKEEHWALDSLATTETDEMKLIGLAFANKAVDEGEILAGVAYVTYDGKIKHVFAQAHS